MAEQSESLDRMQSWLERLQAGDVAARNELINSACQRLTRLTRKMLHDYPGVRRWEETGDVCQNATLRLWNALSALTPRSLPEFFRLAALNIRRELIDLARAYYGPEGLGAHHASWPGGGSSPGPAPGADQGGNTTYEPGRLAAWTEFHQKIDTLPDEDRETFDLLWYQGLSQAEAAALLNVTERTIRRRWRFARLKVQEVLKGAGPFGEG